MTVPAWVWEAPAGALSAAVVAEIVLTARPGGGSFTTRSAIGRAGHEEPGVRDGYEGCRD